MAFQYPVEIPGVSNQFFLQSSVNAVREYRGQAPLDRFDFEEASHNLVPPIFAPMKNHLI